MDWREEVEGARYDMAVLSVDEDVVEDKRWLASCDPCYWEERRNLGGAELEGLECLFIFIV